MLDAKGGSEGAGTPLVATLNAVADALASFGATLIEGAHRGPTRFASSFAVDGFAQGIAKASLVLA